MSSSPNPAQAPVSVQAWARHWAVVPCAGVGSRAGAAGPKQYVAVAGRSVVEWSLLALLNSPSVHRVVVVLSPEDTDFARAVAPEVAQRVWCCYGGGATRAHSVVAGLRACIGQGASVHDAALVHDAARCLLRPAAVERLVAAVAERRAAGSAQQPALPFAVCTGGLLALPLADTIKRDAGSGTAGDTPRVASTVSRDGLWAAQTPQLFGVHELLSALESAISAGAEVTDESSAMERLGHSPLLVQGETRNFKLTYPDDFARAEAWLRAPNASGEGYA